MKYEEVSKILDNIIIYITNTFKCSIEDIINNTQEYIVKLLKNIRLLKYREIDIRRERKKIVDDIEDLKRAYVSGDNLSINEEGKNTGGKENKEYLRQIKMLSLKESLQDKINESMLLEKSLNEHTLMFRELFELIPNPQHQVVIVRMYLGCESATQIAGDYYYSPGTVNVYRKRGTKFLVNLIHEYLETQKN